MRSGTCSTGRSSCLSLSSDHSSCSTLSLAYSVGEFNFILHAFSMSLAGSQVISFSWYVNSPSSNLSKHISSHLSCFSLMPRLGIIWDAQDVNLPLRGEQESIWELIKVRCNPLYHYFLPERERNRHIPSPEELPSPYQPSLRWYFQTLQCLLGGWTFSLTSCTPN